MENIKEKLKSSYAIACPSCGHYAEVRKGFWGGFANTGLFGSSLFGKKKVNCSNPGCSREISIKTDKFTVTNCPNCDNSVFLDQSKGELAACPVCKGTINTKADISKIIQIPCTSCGCTLNVPKGAGDYSCPICDEVVDVTRQANLEDIKNKGIASVIKYEGDNRTFIWKHPIEDFNIGSQLIVHESQEAVFFRDGQALDLFTAGRYTLETASMPLVNNMYNAMLEPGGVFHSEVYYINLTTQTGIKWGTDSKVRFLEPITGIPVDLGASGEFNLRVSDSRKLLIKLVGTEDGLKRDIEDESRAVSSVTRHFRSLIMTRVKTYLARTIKENSINVLEVDEHLDTLSSALQIILNEGLEEYGLTMPEFFVTTIVTPDDDPNFKRLKQQHAEQYLRVKDEEIKRVEAEAAAERKAAQARGDANVNIIQAQGGAEARKIEAQAEAEAYRMQAEAEAMEMRMKGYTYEQETQRQVGLEAMQGGIAGGGSGGVGGGLGDVIGMGIGLGAIGGVMGMARDAIGPITGASTGIGQSVGNMVGGTVTWDCACGVRGIDGNFCSSCGAKKPEIQASALPGIWDCPCGKRGITGKFCSTCGTKQPEEAQLWSCACGQTGISGSFCSNCGSKKKATWDCICGKRGISGNFCDSCGAKEGEKV